MAKPRTLKSLEELATVFAVMNKEIAEKQSSHVLYIEMLRRQLVSTHEFHMLIDSINSEKKEPKKEIKVPSKEEVEGILAEMALEILPIDVDKTVETIRDHISKGISFDDIRAKMKHEMQKASILGMIKSSIEN